MKRTIIKIDETLCNGCGDCVQGCHEGALQLIDGKAVMVSELYCDGLGACIGECPVGAIKLEEREAEPYSEEAVMERISSKGESVILAHLKHLKDHGEKKLLQQGIEYLKSHDMTVNISSIQDEEKLACGCAGSAARSWTGPTKTEKPVFRTAQASASKTDMPVFRTVQATPLASELRQFPVQLHLLNPLASYFHGANVLLAADCTAFAAGNFHSTFLKGKMLAIACPKLDSNTDHYIEKLVLMIDDSLIDTLTVLIMEVPCCGGLVGMAKKAREKASRNIPIKVIVLTVQGDVKSEEWI